MQCANTIMEGVRKQTCVIWHLEDIEVWKQETNEGLKQKAQTKKVRTAQHRRSVHGHVPGISEMSCGFCTIKAYPGGWVQ